MSSVLRKDTYKNPIHYLNKIADKANSPQANPDGLRFFYTQNKGGFYMEITIFARAPPASKQKTEINGDQFNKKHKKRKEIVRTFS